MADDPERRRQHTRVAAEAESDAPELVRCPFCSEQILSTARKCKHCNEWLDSVQTPVAQPGAGSAVIHTGASKPVVVCAFGLLAAFFMPWVQLFGAGMSGYNLGQLGSYGNYAWVIPILSGATILLTFTGVNNRGIGAITGIVPLGAILYGLIRIGGEGGRDATNGVLDIAGQILSIGAWLTIIFSIAIIIAAAVHRPPVSSQGADDFEAADGADVVRHSMASGTAVGSQGVDKGIAGQGAPGLVPASGSDTAGRKVTKQPRDQGRVWLLRKVRDFPTYKVTETGPHSADEIDVLLRSDSIRKVDLVCRIDEDEFREIREVPDFADQSMPLEAGNRDRRVPENEADAGDNVFGLSVAHDGVDSPSGDTTGTAGEPASFCYHCGGEVGVAATACPACGKRL